MIEVITQNPMFQDPIIQAIFLIIGFVLLIKGADVFVDGASNVAYNLKSIINLHGFLNPIC